MATVYVSSENSINLGEVECVVADRVPSPARSKPNNADWKADDRTGGIGIKKRGRYWTCKPNSVTALPPLTIIPLGRPLLNGSSDLPEG